MPLDQCPEEVFIYLFLIYFMLRWVFVALHKLALVAGSRDYSLVLVFRLILWSSVVARRHVESSWARDWTHVPCIGGQILKHWTTRGSAKEVFVILSWCRLRLLFLRRGEVDRSGWSSSSGYCSLLQPKSWWWWGILRMQTLPAPNPCPAFPLPMPGGTLGENPAGWAKLPVSAVPNDVPLAI